MLRWGPPGGGEPTGGDGACCRVCCRPGSAHACAAQPHVCRDPGYNSLSDPQDRQAGRRIYYRDPIPTLRK